jgi:SAM-dependent methyltransferase
MNRNEKLLKYVSKDGLGMEVGPSFNPIAPKKDGYNVQIIDHMSREQLTEKYRDHHVNIENIEEVDFVWKGESYADLTGKNSYYDWIIASHVIEHAPDLIAFLNGCASILKDDGVLSLAIPDKRYCFDRFRPISGLSQVIDKHLQRNLTHTPGSVAEYFLNVVSQEGCIAWDVNTTGEHHLVHSLEDARQSMSLVLNEGSNLDIHAWCFTPHSFRLIIHDLFCLGLTPFREVEFFPTEGCEFYVALSRHGNGLKDARLDVLKIIESESIPPKVIEPEVNVEAQPAASGNRTKKRAKRLITYPPKVIEPEVKVEAQPAVSGNRTKKRAKRLITYLINKFR